MVLVLVFEHGVERCEAVASCRCLNLGHGGLRPQKFEQLIVLLNGLASPPRYEAEGAVAQHLHAVPAAVHEVENVRVRARLKDHAVKLEIERGESLRVEVVEALAHALVQRSVGRLARQFCEFVGLDADRVGPRDEAATCGGERLLAVPLTDDTRGLIDAAALAAMPDGALVVNVARGAVVDTEALVAEVRTGRVRAALDVTDPEPLPEDHELWGLPGVLITPHVGGDSTAMMPRMARLIWRQIEHLKAGETPENLVC